jgi:hypothetical protein
LEVWQRIGSQSIDTLGDTALRLRQARDVGEHGLVAFRSFRCARFSVMATSSFVTFLPLPSVFRLRFFITSPR